MPEYRILVQQNRGDGVFTTKFEHDVEAKFPLEALGKVWSIHTDPTLFNPGKTVRGEAVKGIKLKVRKFLETSKKPQ